MDVLGWVLFVIGALLLIVFAFIGIDAGGIAVGNLAGTLVGSAMMISGAVFISADKVVRAIKGEADEDAQSLPSPPVPKEEPPSKKVETTIAVVTLLLVGLAIVLFGIAVQPGG